MLWYILYTKNKYYACLKNIKNLKVSEKWYDLLHVTSTLVDITSMNWILCLKINYLRYADLSGNAQMSSKIRWKGKESWQLKLWWNVCNHNLFLFQLIYHTQHMFAFSIIIFGLVIYILYLSRLTKIIRLAYENLYTLYLWNIH